MRKLPSFRFEKPFWKKGGLVVGIDEVGRGALAGPLVVGALCLKSTKQVSSLFHIENLGINDSKKLSPKKREKLAKIIKKKCFVWGLAAVSVRFINNHGIVKAFQRGVAQVIKNLKINLPSGGKIKIFILIDGFYVKYLRGIGLKNQRAIVDGDEKSLSIASASIIAKVFRDRLMVRLAREYPKYHWERNKGYGTREHIKALKKYGKTKLHRDLFLRKIFNR